jgi:heme/copper-type cytochrome/quinol oxidase subunit 2
MLMTVLIAVFLTVYLLVAGFALYMTYDEHRKAHNTNPLCHAVSILACLFWPITVLAVAVAMQRKTA